MLVDHVPHVKGSTCLLHVLLRAGVLGAGQQVQAPSVCTCDVLADLNHIPRVVDDSLLLGSDASTRKGHNGQDIAVFCPLFHSTSHPPACHQ